MHERLRNMILGGELLPGQRLTQRELVETLDVGRTPLREALRMLEAEGLVTSTANRGATVTGLDLAEAEELYGMLLLLQPPLLMLKTAEISDATLGEMGKRLTEMRDRPPSHYDCHQAHVDFHVLPEEWFGPVLGQLILDIYQRLGRLQRFYYNRRGLPDYTMDLDEALLEALHRRNGRQVKRAQELHLVNSAVGLILDADPAHRFGPLRRAAASIGIELRTTRDGTIAPPLEVAWAEALDGYRPVSTEVVVDVTPGA
ncbi:GntR family transcriptional regulator [Streptomyces sp. SHP 1-2]|uniref:GntR family transcriptional regulator n=1 Tax=Streptomyces sp. SHP 1-2 TaxID=2769489 RepID=UPI002237A9CB|nr:GntR family transcriptional regulator [Streptomyces sp. SHP 1-2]MCW5253189.1 GntR family transcriptional regulator [Streptomyces sp. SHP 1-2]